MGGHITSYWGVTIITILSKAFLRKTVTIFFLIVLVECALLASAWNYYQNLQVVTEGIEAARKLKEAAASVEKDIGTVSGDIRFLNAEVSAILSQPNIPRDRISEIFSGLASVRPDYFQIRFIDSDGNEQVRIERNAATGALERASKLQNKADRPYFQRGMASDRGNARISDIDLNVEYGKIEVPHNPVIRLTMPVYLAGRNNPEGIVVINYTIRTLLLNLRAITKGTRKEIHVVTDDGFWVSAPNPKDNWGDILGHGRRFSDRYPDVWRLIDGAGPELQREQGRSFITEIIAFNAKNGGGTRAEQTTIESRDLHLIGILHPGSLQDYIGKHVVLASLVGVGALVLAILGSTLLANFFAARQRAEEQRTFQRIITETIADGLIVANQAGTILSVNGAACDMFGYSKQDLVGNNISMLMGKGDAADHPEKMAGYLKRADHLTPSYAMRKVTAVHKGGSGFPAEISVAVARRNNESVIIASVRDIREREAEAAKYLDALEQRRQILDAVSEGVVGLDVEGNVTFVNPAASEMLGYPIDDIVGKKLHSLVHHTKADGGINPEANSPILKTIETGEETQVDADVFWRQDGSALPVRYAADPILDDKGMLRGVVVAFMDLSDIEALKGNNELTIQKLAQVNAELEQFAYVASHDLKSPLRAIDKLSSWIEDDLKDKMADETKEHMTLLRSRVRRLEGLLEGILQYSRAGRKDVALEELDTGAVITSIADLQDKPSGAEVHISKDMPTVEVPRVVFEQVFGNLIGNAIKHNDAANPIVDVSVEEGGDAWIFRVRDNGPGISPKFHERVFGMFQTLQSRDKKEGSGMGLAIVRKLLERYGAKIHIESEGPETGTVFVVQWPKSVRKT